MTLEVVHRHKNLAVESGVEFKPMAPVSGAVFCSICHPPNVCKFCLTGSLATWCYW